MGTKVGEYSTGRCGKLELSFARYQNRTTITQSFFRVPLQIMKPYHDDQTDCLCLYVLSPTGGVVQGDNYQMKIHLSAGTHVLLTTQSATKVYRMPSHGANQHIDFQVGENAILEYLPEPTILFRDSNFEQRINLFLWRGAKAVLQEIIMPGRLARGECLDFTRYQGLLKAFDEKGLLLYDAFCLQPHKPHKPHFRRLGILEEYPCWGSLYLLGDFAGNFRDLDEPKNVREGNQKLEALFEMAMPLLNRQGESLGGISLLHRNGLAMRMVAQNTHLIQSAFQTVWNLLKTEILGLKTIHLRKY